MEKAYKKPRYARRKPKFKHKPITEPGIYEFRIYDVDQIRWGKETGINPPNLNLEPVFQGTVTVYECNDDEGTLVSDQDLSNFLEYDEDALHDLVERGIEGWGTWYANPNCDDDYFCMRKIATNENKVYVNLAPLDTR
jgi:hypothetical protein